MQLVLEFWNIKVEEMRILKQLLILKKRLQKHLSLGSTNTDAHTQQAGKKAVMQPEVLSTQKNKGP